MATAYTSQSASSAPAALPPGLRGGLPAAASPPLLAATSAARGSRIEQLRSVQRKPHEASFFFYDAFFKADAVKVLPGEYFVHNEDVIIMTTLGSCIAACLWDRNARVGGMNHFMLPDVGTGMTDGGRYGSYAMELLINEMLKRGATRGGLEAKVFGGAAVISGMNSLNVGERNTRFVFEYLATERIAVVSKDVLEIYPRKVCFFPASGKAMVKRLASTQTDAVAALDREATQRSRADSAGSVDLF
ncbi:MAG: chemoreceptor glutamine deamidase CheD [Burkholderiales bacterium]|nr:chemoreceptor glutamine deamidase CheD [Burkholderiales bacterium]